jgi:imidazolonepropionase-like amidohydrolase
MTKMVVICGKLFDGLGDALRERMEIRIEDGVIAEVSGAAGRLSGARVIALGDRTVAPGFIDTHVHLCVDGLNRKQQTLQCSAVKALPGLHSAQQYVRCGFTTLRDMGTSIPTGRRSTCATPSRRDWCTARAWSWPRT